jgi:hypothetical protein
MRSFAALRIPAPLSRVGDRPEVGPVPYTGDFQTFI